MKFLYFLSELHNPITDFFFSLITYIGDETVFLVVAILFFWCINKREGYCILLTGLIGTLFNQFLKLICRVPRPWVRDPAFKDKVVPSAIERASGYSFPSGHTQNVTGTFGAIAMFAKRNWLRITSVVIILLVSFSRMYLGVHTPADVGVSLLVAVALVIGFYPLFNDEGRFHKAMPIIIAVSAFLSLGFLIYTAALSPEGLDPHNYESARKNAATLFGCMLGLCIVYPLDRFKIKFTTEGVWYSRVLKLVIGLGLVFAVKAGLSKPLEALFGLFVDDPTLVARTVRYFLIVVVAGVLWPLSFGFFARLRIGFMDRFTAWLLSKTRHAPAHTEK